MKIRKAEVAGFLHKQLIHLESEHKSMLNIKNDPTSVSFFREHYNRLIGDDICVQHTTYCSDNMYMKKVAKVAYSEFMKALELEIENCKRDIDRL